MKPTNNVGSWDPRNLSQKSTRQVQKFWQVSLRIPQNARGVTKEAIIGSDGNMSELPSLHSREEGSYS